MTSLMHYQSHAWGGGRSVCEVYVRLHKGKKPSAGETVLVVLGSRASFPLQVAQARWQDEDATGVLVLAVMADQASAVERLEMGATLHRQ